MKYHPIIRALYAGLLLLFLTGCGGRIYGFRKTVRVHQPVAQTAPTPPKEELPVAIVINTLNKISKPVEVKKKPSVIGSGNTTSSAMIR